MNQLFSDIRDRLLNTAGLEVRRSHVWQGALVFGGGLLLGAALGVLLAPKSGAQLRRDIVQLFEKARREAGEAMEETEEEAERRFGEESERESAIKPPV